MSAVGASIICIVCLVPADLDGNTGAVRCCSLYLEPSKSGVFSWLLTIVPIVRDSQRPAKSAKIQDRTAKQSTSDQCGKRFIAKIASSSFGHFTGTLYVEYLLERHFHSDTMTSPIDGFTD